jgi:hypothetical protein
MNKVLKLLLAASCAAQITCWTPSDLVLPKIYNSKSIDVGSSIRTEDLEKKLELIADVKNFGISELGLSQSENYTRYREKNARTVYRLYITRKTKLPDLLENWLYVPDPIEYREPHISAILFSEKDDLKDEKEFYENAGYDVNHRTIHDFNDEQGCEITTEFLD